VVRILLFLLGMLTADGPARRAATRHRGGRHEWSDPETAEADPDWPDSDGGTPGQTSPLPSWAPQPPGYGRPVRPGGWGAEPAPPRGESARPRSHPGAMRRRPVARQSHPAAWHGDLAIARSDPADRHGDLATARSDPADRHGDLATARSDPADWRGYPAGRGGDPAGWREKPRPRRPRVPRWIKWTAGLVVIGLIFRRVIAAVTLMALSGALHLVGINVHLPHIKLEWPWQTITAGTTTNTDLGPWVLQKIEGISKPALGEANFTFVFTHKVSKNIGFWPCWYQSTFYAVGHASATVNLNPGAAWWSPATGHYRLQVLSRPGAGRPGQVAVTMVLPLPQLPQSAHDVTIDNIPSKPIATDHSWTYPGFGCGVLIRPQFPDSVLYAEAQTIAFDKSRQSPDISHQLIGAAETEAVQTIRDNFVQPTVNAFGYKLDRFSIRWTSAP
jgi:hypothetical protein